MSYYFTTDLSVVRQLGEAMYPGSDALLSDTAAIAEDPENFFDSPVPTLDVDFANVWMKYETAGGVSKLDALVNDPWKFECKRLD